MTGSNQYEGFGWSLEEAIRAAHDQVPNRTEGELELAKSRLVIAEIQRNGFVQSISFRAVVEEDATSPSWSEPPR